MESKKEGNIKLFPWLCSLIYFTAYLSRKIYAISISLICDAENIPVEEYKLVGLSVTGLFISYGFGQIISGVLGDKVNSKKLVAIGMIGTGICNLLVGIMPHFSKNIALITIIWVFNGLFQSFFWPPIIKLLAANCDDQVYVKGMSKVIMASQISEVVLYLIVPPFSLFSNLKWRLLFIVIAALCVGIAILWIFMTKNLKDGRVQHKDDVGAKNYSSKSLIAALIASGILLYGFPIVIIGMIRDGVSTWAPTFTKETFEIPAELSILINVGIAIISMIAIKLASRLLKKLKNELLVATLSFSVSLICMSTLVFVYDKIPILTTILLSISIACTHGTNLMLIGCVPSYFKYTGRVSTVSGIVNGIIYIGSALSTYVFAAIAEKMDWKYVILIWAGLCFVGTLLLALNIKRWERFSIHMKELSESQEAIQE